MNKAKLTSSLGLLYEGIRQCRMVGILSLVISVLGAVLVPVGEVFSNSPDQGEEFVALAHNAWAMHPLLLVAIAAAPLMTMILFRFLNIRAASDLYHAVPHKRIKLYASYVGAILFWTLLAIVVSETVSVIVCAIAHKHIALIMNTVLPYMTSVLLICLLLVGGILLAMSLSGTTFTNMVLAALILFLPRFCYTILAVSMTEGLPFLNADTMGLFSNSCDNILFGIAACIVDMYETAGLTDYLNPNWQQIIYTLALSLIYLGLGAWCFCRRRSETAGQAAPTRIHQHVYRIIVTMAYCLCVTVVMFNDMRYDSYFNEAMIFGYIVAYLIGVLIYMVYELITTRKWRNLLTSLPGLAIVAVLNVGIVLGMTAVENHITSQRPAASEIKSVSINADASGASNTYMVDYSTYASIMTSSIEISDPTAISLISYYLDENIKTWESGYDAYSNKYYNGRGDYSSYDVTIRTKNKTLSRVVFIPNSESEKLFAAIENTSGYVDMWMNVPDPIKDTMWVEDISRSHAELSQDCMEQLFETYKKELKNVPFEEFYTRLMTYYDYDIGICYSFQNDSMTGRVNCPVFEDLMPETMKMYFQFVYDTQKEDIDRFEEYIDSGKYGYIDIDAYSEEYNAYDYNTGEGVGAEEMYEHLKPYILDEPIQVGGAYADIFLNPVDYNDAYVGFNVAIDEAFFEDEFLKKYLVINSRSETESVEYEG